MSGMVGVEDQVMALAICSMDWPGTDMLAMEVVLALNAGVVVDVDMADGRERTRMDWRIQPDQESFAWGERCNYHLLPMAVMAAGPHGFVLGECRYRAWTFVAAGYFDGTFTSLPTVGVKV
jgi:hypothetical protein